MDFLVDNYMWFIFGAVVILMTVVGYLAEKTDFASKKRDKNNKEESGQAPATPVAEPQIAMPVSNDNMNIAGPVENVQTPVDNTVGTNMGSPSVDGVPSELFAPINAIDVNDVVITEPIEKVNIPTDDTVVSPHVADADGVNFDDLYAPVDVPNNDTAQNQEATYDNMEDENAQVSTIQEEVSSDPLFTANVVPLDNSVEEEKPPVDPWAPEEEASVEVDNNTTEVSTTEQTQEMVQPVEQPVAEVAPEMAVAEVTPVDVVDPTMDQPVEQPVAEVAPEMAVAEVTPVDVVDPTMDQPVEQPVAEVAPEMAVPEVTPVDVVDPTMDQPVEQPVAEVAPEMAVPEVTPVDVVDPTMVQPVEQPVAEVAPEMAVPEVTPVDVVDPTMVQPVEQPVAEVAPEMAVAEVAPVVVDTTTDVQTGQPLFDLQFDQIYPGDPVVINKENADAVMNENSDSAEGEDVWKF